MGYADYRPIVYDGKLTLEQLNKWASDWLKNNLGFVPAKYKYSIIENADSSVAIMFTSRTAMPIYFAVYYTTTDKFE
jgi:hypothetical protein